MRDRATLARVVATLVVAGLACLDDSPTAPAVGAARLRIQAYVEGSSQAVDRTLRIRVFYRRSTGGAATQEINLTASPTQIVVASGATRSEEVIVNLGPCFGDAQRVGAESGCRFTVELTLVDTDGEMLSRQEQEVTASAPGATVEPPPISLPAAEIGVASTAVTLTAEELAAAPAPQEVAITSVTGAPLGNVTATVSYTSGTDWLTHDIEQRQNTKVLTLRASSPNVVAPVTYSATVTIRSSRPGVRAKDVAVTYSITPRARTLIVAPHGTGSGRVTSTPAGIDCTLGETGAGGTCSASFPHATQVTLTALASPGTAFIAFTGACSGTSCQVTMDQPRDQPRAVGATFEFARRRLTVAGEGDGSGVVTSSPAGIDCSVSNGAATGACGADFDASTQVTLTATPRAGSGFIGFGGACSGSSCQLTVDQPRAASATFWLVGDGRIVGKILDAVTNEPLGAATVALRRGAAATPRQTTTGADGRFAFGGLASGTYSMEALRTGYVTNTAPSVAVDQISGGDEVLVDFALPTNASTKRFASVSGRVTTVTGGALANASVSISGGSQTNGVFQATTTDARGNFSLNGIVLDDASGQAIRELVVSAAMPGFARSARVVQLTRNQTLANVKLTLSPATALEYFSDDFEGSSDLAWTATGFWNRINLAATTVTNSAYPTYVELAPDDPSAGRLPQAARGSFAFWYGQASAGNYMGPQIAGDPGLSGGTGTAPNAGRILSPAFTIADAAPVSLSFDTWFEIESVNPNASGFDIMSVIVLRAGVEDTLGRVNPFVDPPLGEHDAVPFTSGGFNRAPVWRTVQFDLGAYRGQTIRLVFDFDTVDPSFNGFRGWIVDNVRVTNDAVAAGNAALVVNSRLGQPRTIRQPRARPAPRNSGTRSAPR